MTDDDRHGGVLPPSVVAALLAGGSGSRFHVPAESERPSHKLAAQLPATSTEPAQTVFERATRHVCRSGFGHVIVVTGSWQAPELPSALTAALTVVDNPDWAAGQITSVRLAITTAANLGAERVVIGLADQPFVTPDAWRTVGQAAGPIAVATYGGRRGNPVALDSTVWDLLPDAGDEGARALMRIRPDLVREVACSGSPADIDTAEDLRRWQNN